MFSFIIQFSYAISTLICTPTRAQEHVLCGIVNVVLHCSFSTAVFINYVADFVLSVDFSDFVSRSQDFFTKGNETYVYT